MSARLRIKIFMRKRYIQNIIAGLITMVITLWSAAPAAVFAQAKTTPPPPNYGQALEIAPPVIYLTVNPGQTVKTQIFLRDISSGELIVTGEANDFTASGEDGTPKLILDKDEGNNPYSMKSWVVAPAELRLVPREVKTMAITINVPKSASPGGHYGIIRFTATPPSLKSSGVSLSTSLGALMLVTVNGAVSEKLTVTDFSVKDKNNKTGSVFQSGPLTFVERIKNEGNIHEQPVGQVTIKDMFGRKVANVNINLPPRNILPASTRRFEQPLDKSVIGNKRLFGKYTANLAVTYGKNKQTTSSTLSFWVIPYRLIAIIIVALVAGFFILRYALRRYNRYIIGGASGSKKRRRK
jgi:hypothetical protein